VKITKLSLAAIAAMTLTTGAMAEVTADFSGGVKLWYETADSSDVTGVNKDNGLFHKNASGLTHGDAVVSLEAKGKAGVLGYGFKYTATDTLGLENNLVSGRRSFGRDNGPLGTSHWAEKAFITYKMGNTTAKIGRQHLNTPLAFTETWNATANSFDAAVLMNTDIENVTLVGAYVGKGNGSGSDSLANASNGNVVGAPGFTTTAADGEFKDYVVNGAYAAAILAKPMKDLGLNVWYYNVKEVANAAWIDGNYAINGVNLGAIYAQMMPQSSLSGNDDTTAVAVKAGTKVGGVSLLAAYSQVSSKGLLPVGNTATGFKKTKLPTAGVYSDGLIVAAPGAKTVKVKAAMPVGSFKLAAQYITTTNDKDGSSAFNAATASSAFGREVDEFDLIASTKIADVNLKAIFINRTFKNSTTNAGPAVLAHDSNHVRIIAGINF